jgi:DNA primase
VETVAALLAQVPNAAYREQLLQQAATRLQTAPTVLQEEIDRLRSSARRTRSTRSEPAPARREESGEVASPAPPAATAPVRCDIEVREALTLLLARPEMVGEFLRAVHLDWLRDRAGVGLLERAIEMANDGMLDGVESFSGQVEAGELKLLESLRTDFLASMDAAAVQSVMDTLGAKIRARWVRDQILLISRQMADPALGTEAKQALLARQMELRSSLTGAR